MLDRFDSRTRDLVLLAGIVLIAILVMLAVLWSLSDEGSSPPRGADRTELGFGAS